MKHVINNKAIKWNTCRDNFNSLSDMLEHDQKKHQDKKKIRIPPALFSVRACLMNLMYEIPGGDVYR